MKRRELLNLAVAAGATTALPHSVSVRADEPVTPPVLPALIDTNVSLFQWPFRRLPLDQPELLVRKLRSLGVTQAWAGSFEAVLHRDMSAVNQRLADTCLRYPELLPIGSVNPKLPDWQHDLRQCVSRFHMPGIRLYPNYHGYTLNEPVVQQLLEQASAASCLVQIAASMEDTRTQHPMLQVSDVDLTPLTELVPRIPQARVQILNYRPRLPASAALAATAGICFDTARVDSTDGVPALVRNSPPGRVLFGTHAPFLIPEAALIRVHESDQLDATELQAVYAGNAQQLINRSHA